MTWWLDTKWLRHHNTVEAVHPLIVRLQEARGPAFMTCGHVLDVLDTRDPAALVESWVSAAPSRGLGLPVRLCAWCECDETCERHMRAANAKFCKAHAAATKRKADREYAQRIRSGKSSPSPALAK